MNGGTFFDTLDTLVDELEVGELTLRAAQAHRLACIEALMNAVGGSDSTVVAEGVESEVAALLHVSTRTASRMCDEAALICGRPAIYAALSEGRIDLSRAKLIAVLLGSEDLQELLEQAAILYAYTHTTHELRRWLLSRLPDAGDDAARKTAFDKRCVQITQDRDGMSDLYAYLPSEVAESLFDTLDRLARENVVPDETRTLDQRRADAVADLLDERTTVTTQVNVVLPATGIGASVNGCPIPWPAAWQLAVSASAGWAAWLAAPDGRVVNTSPGKYRIPMALARTVRARDQHCRFPGCHVPAARCDLDHLVAWPQGLTTDENLHCLCRRHHRIKHQTGWKVTHLGDNVLEWTSPAGRTYRTRPPNALGYAA
jgi:hypothetical protein